MCLLLYYNPTHYTVYVVHLTVISIWRIWLQLPNLMYTNTTYNHVLYYEHCALNTALFTKLKYPPCALHPNSPNFLFAKYTMYTVYSISLLDQMSVIGVSHSHDHYWIVRYKCQSEALKILQSLLANVKVDILQYHAVLVS